MDSSSMVDVAKSYCEIRFVSLISTALTLGILSCLYAMFLQTSSHDTSKFLPIEATVLDAMVKKMDDDLYTVDVLFAYDVGQMQYRVVLPFNSFETRALADMYVRSMAERQTLYYDQRNPQNAVVYRDGEDDLMIFLVCGALLMVIIAAIVYAFKDNPIFCGMQIGGDTIGLFNQLFS